MPSAASVRPASAPFPLFASLRTPGATTNDLRASSSSFATTYIRSRCEGAHFRDTLFRIALGVYCTVMVTAAGAVATPFNVIL
jgi:hypothetical protein